MAPTDEKQKVADTPALEHYSHSSLPVNSLPVNSEDLEVRGPSCRRHHRCRNPKHRFLRALAIFFFLYLICRGLFKYIPRYLDCKFEQYYQLHHLESDATLLPEYLIPPDVNIIVCTDWSDMDSLGNPRHIRPEPRLAKTTFTLPFPSENLFLLSRGSSVGKVNVVQSSSITEDDGVVKVDVEVKYRRPSALQHVKVCSISREGDENGVGIFVS